jgi:hypothetical protein
VVRERTEKAVLPGNGIGDEVNENEDSKPSCLRETARLSDN